MKIHITNHACIRYIERSLKINLEEIKKTNLNDAQILKTLCINKEELYKQIVSDYDKTISILETIGGKDSNCKIGIGTSHQAVFCGNRLVTVIHD